MSNLTNMIPRYDTKLFTEVWEVVNDFIYDYNQLPAGMRVMKSDLSTLTTLFYLLYAKYGNNPIANMDENQWKFKVFSIIYQFGPTWEKKQDIQNKLRALTDDELFQGAKAIYNNAVNPGEAPTTGTLEELNYINSQNTTNYKKAKMEAYTELWDILNDDITARFIEKFRPCFKIFVQPERQFIYVTEDENE